IGASYTLGAPQTAAADAGISYAGVTSTGQAVVNEFIDGVCVTTAASCGGINGLSANSTTSIASPVMVPLDSTGEGAFDVFLNVYASAQPCQMDVTCQSVNATASATVSIDQNSSDASMYSLRFPPSVGTELPTPLAASWLYMLSALGGLVALSRRA